MEKFKGNGAECMVRFIQDGCKGTIRSDDSRQVLSLMEKEYWDDAIYKNDNSNWSILWLADPCTYYPPEPTYRAATPGEALDAALSGKHVQVEEWLDEEGTKRRWEDATKRMKIHSWDGRRKYRIRL